MAVAVEEIPDTARLFRRIHRHFFDTETGRISSAAFEGEEMSVNWEKYATAESTALQDRSGNTAAVVSLTCGICRELGQVVRHDPVIGDDQAPLNPAHTLVCGRKSRPIKQRLRDPAVVVWRQVS
jgi:hypothetical protein